MNHATQSGVQPVSQKKPVLYLNHINKGSVTLTKNFIKKKDESSFKNKDMPNLPINVHMIIQVK